MSRPRWDRARVNWDRVFLLVANLAIWAAIAVLIVVWMMARRA